MTCKDCVHYDVCQYHIDEETPFSVTECNNFKNKSDFVEVVRCKDCKHLHRVHSCVYRVDGVGYKNVSPDDFCSYGEQKRTI